MPDITQRIADILKHHRFERCSESRSGYFAWWGRCSGCGVESQRSHIADGWEIDMQADESAHVAEVLTAELGLTQEWSVGTCGKQVVMSERSAKDNAARWPESFEAASRYVTEWVPDE